MALLIFSFPSAFLALASTIFRIADCSIDFVNFTRKNKRISKPSEISQLDKNQGDIWHFEKVYHK